MMDKAAIRLAKSYKALVVEMDMKISHFKRGYCLNHIGKVINKFL